MQFFARIPVNLRWALVIAALVVAWMASGVLFPAAPEDTQATTTPQYTALTVTTRRLTPQPYTRTLQLVGRSEPLAQVALAAQTKGEITVLKVDRGSVVQAGMALLTIDMGTRKADLAAAKAQVKAAQALVTTSRNLLKEGFAAETTLAEQEAALATAQQNQAAIEEDIAHTTVTAPINGVVEERLVDVGDYVGVGTPLFTLVGRDAFLLVAYAPQQDQQLIQLNQPATATLANGQQISGTVRFIATDAKPETKTYRVDVQVDGAQFQIPTGMTAAIDLPVAQTEAYLVPHSLLVLADDGTVGLMSVAQENNTAVARFVPVTMLTDTPDGLWVTGLPDGGLTIITRGQAAVKDGSPVTVEPEKESN